MPKQGSQSVPSGGANSDDQKGPIQSSEIIIKTPSGKLDFPNDRAQIILDDPRRQVSSGEDAYTHAEKRLKVAATVGQVKAYIERRECQVGCICIEKYATYKPERIDFWFT